MGRFKKLGGGLSIFNFFGERMERLYRKEGLNKRIHFWVVFFNLDLEFSLKNYCPLMQGTLLCGLFFHFFLLGRGITLLA